MKHVKLDRIDLKILRELQKDGRMTNVDLAKHVGISAPPCLRRVRALEEGGYIRSYHAEVAAERLGYKEIDFIFVSLASHTEAELSAFAALVDGWAQVRECYTVSGESDFMLKVVSKDREEFNAFQGELRRAPNFAHVNSIAVQTRTKYDPGVPIDEKAGVMPPKKDI